MNLNGSPLTRTKSVSVSLFVIIILLFSSFSNAQTPANFSGVWIQDSIKSDDFYKSFDVKYIITQNLQTFTVKQIFTIKGSTENVTNDYSFTLDGKATTMKKETGLEKNLANWSANKKSLTTRSTITYGKEDVGFTETYSISDNGLVLTAVKADIIPGTLSVKQVFNKKQ
jgi:hypothetical protein